MARSRVFVTVTVASFSLVLLRCSGFSADPTPATEDGAAEAGAEAESEASAEAGPIVDGGGADASEASTDAAKPPATTCAELQDAGTVASGIYTIAGIERYCEMTLEGGGWTLVARSAGGATPGTFGWKQSRGDVNSDGAYSLDATKVGTFTMLLFGQRVTGSNSLVPPIYLKSLPSGSSSLFLANYGSTADSTPTTTVDGGGCVPNMGGPTWLSYIGFTENADYYFFRDNAGTATLGLMPTGWVSTSGCVPGGDLDGVLAAIYVR